MAPKKKDSKNEEQQDEPPLQAVILSDTYETKFAPLTMDRPRILLQLCGTPIIEYTLNFLASNGVQEVFLYLPASHVDQVDEYIQNSKWQTTSSKSTSPFSRLELIRTTSTSVGDCLRDLDARGTMKGDFLVVYGDLISTLDITPALQQHKARRLANKDRIFTTVLTRAAGHDRAHGNYTPVFTIDPQSSRLLQYDQLLHSSSGSEHAMPLSAELFSDHQELDIMTGLTDTGIDICTVDVLALWQDSFDLQDPRRQFLKLALRDYELNNKTFYAHITESGYSARVRDLSSYKSVSNDLISRRAYPFVPEMNMLSNQEFKLYRNKNYREAGVILHRQAIAEKNSAIGQGTSIGADSVVTGSTIGRNCLIGRGVRIENSHIFDNTSVGDFTTIKDSIVAGEVVIGKRCEVLDRSLLSWSCRISDGISLKNKKITLQHSGPTEDSGYFNIVGDKGKGVEYRPEGDEVVDEDLGSVSDVDSISTLHSEDSDIDSEFEQRERTASFISVDSEHAQESREFDKEASENILDALNRGVEPENMLLELNSFRSSTNSSLDQVRRAVASGLWTYLNTQSFSPKKLKEEVEKNQELVRRFTLNTNDQVDFLVLLQKDAAKTGNPTLFRSLTFALASEDLVDAEGLKSWWESERSMETEALSSVRKPTEDVVQAVLKQAEESDESEEDESEEDDDMQRPRSSTTVLSHARSYTLTTHLGTKQQPICPCSLTPVSVPNFATTAESSACPTTPPSSQPVSSSRDLLATQSLTTAPTTRKRKAEKDLAASQTHTKPPPAKKPQKKASPASPPPAPAILTPATETISMDSEDEFNSPQSSGDEGMADFDSDVSDQEMGSDDELEDFDDDAGFESQDKISKVQKKAFEVDFKVYSPNDIRRFQEKEIDEVKDLLGQPPENAAILLRRYRWNRERLLDAYMEKQMEVLDAAGLEEDESGHSKIQAVEGFMCDICCEDDAGMQTFALKCEHRFCVDCYKTYLANKIKDEGEAARIKCPGNNCNRVVDSRSLNTLVSGSLRDRYEELLTRTYVDDLENLKWCPSPNCVYAVDCKIKNRDLGRIVPTVKCDCDHQFCFGCAQNDHQPAPCGLVKKWMKKCEDDSETANWISANTKECPRCHSTIEKNGGCNHMTCRKCKHEFCWMCMGVWSEHGTSWYNCNRFEEKSGHEARSEQAKSRQSLERYLHYYNRYANHEQSAKLDKDIYIKTEKKMTQLQTTAAMSWIEVQFLERASQALQHCRQTLKWTYAFAFYLARNNQTEIFEDNQRDLEMAVENLSEMFEKPVDQLSGLRVEMMDKTSYCERRRVILLDDTAQNLKNGKWEFNTDLS
ncbi:hypothetical protein Vi05172_g8515 [Venturia inaequalis]|uniref:Mannose-1-phosphate guanyltransferase n=1 Tax=Venturia inaequalis TaxID=5025 RepID=A0A8H3USX6_VENIN|nr:hypothetical protein EG327_008532 [Venturia inaequalis]RDI81314.1 hypothetical protein Vi05172_g8515 [Venturia inaequalis]